MVRLERVFFKAGFALLAVWGAATLHGIVLSRVALAQFQAIQGAKAANIPVQPSTPAQQGLASGSSVDFGFWSLGRVQAYKDSLLGKVDPPLAVLRISKIQLEVPVFEGTGGAILNRGAGRIVGTAQLGAGGNLGIAGHRDGFFRGLKDVAKGDVIELSNHTMRSSLCSSMNQTDLRRRADGPEGRSADHAAGGAVRLRRRT